MRRSGDMQPFLLGVPGEEEGHRIMVDPTYFAGLDEVGDLLAEIAEVFAQGFVQSGRAMDMADAMEQIEESLVLALHETTSSPED
ncbi:MAG: hypothetical protein AAF253_08750 [Pseudomonadota bacterium]